MYGADHKLTLGGGEQALRVLDVVALSRVDARMLARRVVNQERPQDRPDHPQRTCNERRAAGTSN